jgi:hypothetical protein
VAKPAAWHLLLAVEAPGGVIGQGGAAHHYDRIVSTEGQDPANESAQSAPHARVRARGRLPT